MRIIIKFPSLPVAPTLTSKSSYNTIGVRIPNDLFAVSLTLLINGWPSLLGPVSAPLETFPTQTLL
jgi:hypothetical protein